MSETQASAAQAVPAAASDPRPWLSAYPAGVDWNTTFKPLATHELLERSVARHPASVCTHFLGRTMTYAEVGRAVNHAAAGFQRLGVRKGTKVGLFLPNAPTFVVAYYAVLKAGGTIVNYNPLYSLEELEHQIKDSETEIMVTLDLKALFPKIEALLSKGVLKQAVVASFTALLPALKGTLFRLARGHDLTDPAASPVRDKLVLQKDLLANDGVPTPVAIDPLKDLAVLQYTGGTTGTPKGAMLTHANLTVNVEQVAAWAGDIGEAEERFMGILPFFHVFAMTTVMNFGVSRAAQLILVPKFEIGETLKLIGSVKPTVMPGVPTLFNAILNNRSVKTYDLSSIKFCLSGGAPLPLEVKRGFEGLTGAKLVEGYGLSETSPVVTANPLVGPVKEGSIGQPLPRTTISIRSIDEPDKVMPQGEPGEICIAGPQVMPGYWNKPAETAGVFTGEFFRTGDIGTMDAEGFIFIVDRLKDMINASGFKVYPRRIEEVLYEHPAIEEAIVIGIPDKYRGEAPKAFVKLRQGQATDTALIMSFLKPRLSKLELPSEIEIRDSLPKTMIGKLSKKELKAEEMAKRKA